MNCPPLPGNEPSPIEPAPEESPEAGTGLRGPEPITVLLAEDEPSVRAFARHVLLSAGYAVLEAANGRDALQVSAGHPGPIRLLVTDVTMPYLGGCQLAELLCQRYRDLKVLYLSGYTEESLFRQGIQRSELAFLQKPFSPATLLAKVRAILGTR
jgi:two-component system cell cycle sensor histidine kinase/response regulator CckA